MIATKAQQLAELDAREDAIRCILARRTLLDFARYVFPRYEPNWHHVYLCQRLDARVDAMVRGDVEQLRKLLRLLIFCPPGVGKSMLISQLLPAYLLGRLPDKKIIAASHNARMATRMSRRSLRIMQSAAYQRVFPNTQLGNGRDATSKSASLFEVLGREGIYESVGVGQGILGARMDVGIIDDPFGSREQAESKVERAKVHDWYDDDFLSRAYDELVLQIIMHQRVHDEDLAGKVMKEMAEGGAQWEIIDIPSIKDSRREPLPVPVDYSYDPREEGEALWPEMNGKPKFSLMHLEPLKKKPRSWNSMHQQRPTLGEGDIFQRDWVQYYVKSAASGSISLYGSDENGNVSVTFHPAKVRRFITCDGAWSKNTTSDDCAMAVWAVVKDNRKRHLVLLDIVTAKTTAPEAARILAALMKQWDVRENYVECDGGGLALLQIARELGLFTQELHTKGKDKIARAGEASGPMAASQVWFPTAVACPKVGELVAQMMAFPAAAHDDMVDVVMYGIEVALLRAPINEAPSMLGGAPSIPKSLPQRSPHADARPARW